MPSQRKSGRTKEIKKSSATETDAVNPAVELARLQEQIKLLQIENEILREHMNKRSPVSPEVNDPTLERNAPIQSTEKSSKVVKSCSCKGNCSSKICGCVKRKTKCTEHCKCVQATCQNQENHDDDDTENVNTANQHLKNARSSHGLFSPATERKTVNTNIKDYRVPSITFSNARSLTFSPSDKENDDDSEGKKNKSDSESDEQEKEIKPKRVARRPKKNLLNDPAKKNVKKKRSASNEENKEKPNSNVAIYQLRRCLSNDSDILTDDTSDIIFNPPIKPQNHLKNILHGMKPLRQTRRKQLEHVENVREKSPTLTKPEHTNKKSNKSKQKEQKEKIKKNTNVMEVAQPKEIDRKLSNASTGSDKSSVVYSDDQLDALTNDSDFDPTKPKHQLMRTPPRNSSELKTSPVLRPSDILLPIPISETVEEEEEEASLAPELLAPNVDWNQHQAQLVPCKRCKRKFLPVRIKKHEACCKGL